jgi:signal transduction histidine kinase
LVSGGDWFVWLNLASERPFNISETTLRQIESLVSLGAAVIHTQRLQQGMEERLREMSELQRTMSHEAWSTYLSRSQHGISGYVFDNLRTRPLSIEEISSFHPSIDTQGLETAQPHIYKTSLAIGGETVGILGVREDPNIGISEEEKALMEAIAEQVSQALERTRLIEQTQKSAVELQAVARVSSVSSTILDPIYLLQSVVDLAKKSFGLYHAHAYMLDETGSKLVLAAGAGDIGREMVAKGWEILIDEESIVTRAARLRQGQIVNNVNQEKGFLPNPLLPDTVSEMAIPMIVGNRLLGVFDAQSDRVNYFTDEDLRTYNTLASQTAVALQNAQLFAEQAMTVERLRELDHLKSSFMANMSHELRTPLNSILGFTQVILEGIDGPLTDFMDTDLQLIEKNGKHLLNLINEVLDMAKIESGRLSLTFEAVDLRELLGDVLETTSPQAKDKNIYLRLDANPEDDLVVTADQIRMRQVMLNLVANAIKFTDTGGVTIHINKTGDLLRIRFLDTGIGIPIDKLETIFEAFSQVDTSTTRKAGGTGLGLPISRRLVEMHGGRLWAESKGMSGDGSTFHLDIPVHPPIK